MKNILFKSAPNMFWVVEHCSVSDLFTVRMGLQKASFCKFDIEERFYKWIETTGLKKKDLEPNDFINFILIQAEIQMARLN